MKILIVGGDDALLSFLTKELEARGYEVVPTILGTADCRSIKKTARGSLS